MILFSTKNLEVKKVILPVTRTETKIEYFIDHKNGKGITSAKTLELAMHFASSFQSILNKG